MEYWIICDIDSSTSTLLFLRLVFSVFVLPVVLVGEHGLLRTPQLAVQTIPVNELLMRALLRNPARLEHNNDIRVVDCAQPVRNEYGCALLLAHQRVDVREERLLCVCIEGGRLWLVSSNSDSDTDRWEIMHVPPRRRRAVAGLSR